MKRSYPFLILTVLALLLLSYGESQETEPNRQIAAQKPLASKVSQPSVVIADFTPLEIEKIDSSN
jgi:hypothetical protein